ncbi:vesicle-trafficking protein SEC22b-like protein [Leptotrombidium deliense]|uniref:Vesicle-trafficking protein SEC22b-like protein n=1 Tax=Leptotrombidium deliense TaxID=299467 RepID=A0A443SR60_9ACAR|nr:vesicle-trafficking protein SEC22b-like protein [Leptotrombidium deliense]
MLMTMIARVSDGLPLAASVQENEQMGRSVMEYQNQAKMLFKKLTIDSPSQMTIETGPFLFHYLIDNGICYLVMCEKTFSKRLAFSYLEDLQGEFVNQYGSRVNTVNRPYSFIEFDTYMQKAKRSFMDSRARRNLSQLNSELQDVQKIMVQNIDDVLQRGIAISDLDNKASNLSLMSQKYRKEARYLNIRATYAKAAAAGVILFVVILYFWVL